MNRRLLNIMVRTPHEVVLETAVRSLRVLTESGQVGLRPAGERQVLAFEAGIACLRMADETMRFLGTGGGLLSCDGRTATLLTPLAVVGEDEDSIAAQLESAMSRPDSEMETRSILTRLEGEIVNELRRDRLTGIRGASRE